MRKSAILWSGICLLGLISPSPVRAEIKVSPARVQEITAWLPKEPRGLGTSITNRAAWEKLAAAPAFQSFLKHAAQQVNTPLPPQPDDLFLDFSKTGNRDRWQNVAFTRRARISTFTLAEATENKGHYLRALEETIQAICAEKTWLYPAHDKTNRNFNGNDIDIDLGSATLAHDLVTANYILGSKLSPATRKLIRETVRKRIFEPFHAMAEGRKQANFWMHGDNNWNAVCLSGVVGSALAQIPSAEERAWFIAAGEISIQSFLGGFTPDGYCGEGVGYWNYGFGHFIRLSETIRQQTDGHLDLLASPQALKPALFPWNIQIGNGIYPSIADCHPGARPDPAITCYLSRRFGWEKSACQFFKSDAPGSVLNGSVFYNFLPENLPVLSKSPGPATATLPERTWFDQGGVLICRPAAGSNTDFAVSLKGGHNGESHNHNDLGSFIVLVGQSMVLTDPGSEVYTARTFSKQRYESDVLNSYGHSVPVLAGQLQVAGAKHRAVVVSTNFTATTDSLTLDLRTAYAVTNLNRMKRTFTYQRTEPSLTVQDDVVFGSPETFATALITWGEWKQVSTNELLVTDGADAVRVCIDTGKVPFQVKAETLTANVTTSRKPVRIGINLDQPVTKTLVTLTITPEPKSK